MGHRTLVLTPLAITRMLLTLGDGTIPMDLAPGKCGVYIDTEGERHLRIYLDVESKEWGETRPCVLMKQVFWTPYLKMTKPSEQPNAAKVCQNLMQAAASLKDAIAKGHTIDSPTLARWLDEQAQLLAHDLAHHQSDIEPEKWKPF